MPALNFLQGDASVLRIKGYGGKGYGVRGKENPLRRRRGFDSQTNGKA
jgi:hypothetical protein